MYCSVSQQYTTRRCGGFAHRCVAVCCSVPQCAAVRCCVGVDADVCCRCNTLQHTAAHCSTLQHTATHCTCCSSEAISLHTAIQQQTATHCNTLQHTAPNFTCRSSEAMALHTVHKNHHQQWKYGPSHDLLNAQSINVTICLHILEYTYMYIYVHTHICKSSPTMKIWPQPWPTKKCTMNQCNYLLTRIHIYLHKHTCTYMYIHIYANHHQWWKNGPGHDLQKVK